MALCRVREYEHVGRELCFLILHGAYATVWILKIEMRQLDTYGRENLGCRRAGWVPWVPAEYQLPHGGNQHVSRSSKSVLDNPDFRKRKRREGSRGGTLHASRSSKNVLHGLDFRKRKRGKGEI